MKENGFFSSIHKALLATQAPRPCTPASGVLLKRLYAISAID
jgi:hypothetical protein